MLSKLSALHKSHPKMNERPHSPNSTHFSRISLVTAKLWKVHRSSNEKQQSTYYNFFRHPSHISYYILNIFPNVPTTLIHKLAPQIYSRPSSKIDDTWHNNKMCHDNHNFSKVPFALNELRNNLFGLTSKRPDGVTVQAYVLPNPRLVVGHDEC